jgi:hypothetical protein
MARSFSVGCLAALVGLVACEPNSPLEPTGDPQLALAGGPVRATGGGHYLLGGAFPGKFSFTAVQTSPDGTATGHLRYTLDFGGPLDFAGSVTCLAVDADEGRAWIGGVVTRNNSVVEPFASDARFQPGQDIWFRVLDSGEGRSEPDRTTFTGFRGDAGFDTSLEYCAGMPWPDDNARTHPVTAGNIQVK